LDTNPWEDRTESVHLSARQHEVARCVAVGMTDSEIGATLGISARTARMHCDALRVRLGVGNRRQIPFAYRRLLDADPFEPLDLLAGKADE
jgi:DNA-binding CsgD family transcriptional regulator